MCILVAPGAEVCSCKGASIQVEEVQVADHSFAVFLLVEASFIGGGGGLTNGEGLEDGVSPHDGAVLIAEVMQAMVGTDTQTVAQTEILRADARGYCFWIGGP